MNDLNNKKMSDLDASNRLEYTAINSNNEYTAQPIFINDNDNNNIILNISIKYLYIQKIL